MQVFNLLNHNKKTILALGSESAGNFSVFNDGKIYFSEDFKDLLEENNFIRFKKEVLAFLKKENVKPDIILTDLHPIMKTTLWGEALSKKYKAQHIQVQHHHAHIFSTIGERIIQDTKYQLPNTIHGITMDGTGYGEDEKIWGGEVFQVKSEKLKVKSIKRIGHLENQILLGRELAIREPARMLIAILSKFLSKKEVYNFTKKYYSTQEFEVLHNQLEQNFNCLETSSTGRVLDAVSLLLGFCGNERKYKHEPIDLLEKNSTKPYFLKPIIKNNILLTTPLFAYLIKNMREDKRRLAATAQFYIAEGLWEIISKEKTGLNSEKCASSSVPLEPHSYGKIKSGNNAAYIASNLALLETKNSGGTPEIAIIQDQIFSAGGLANNRIISDYFISKNALTSQTIPRGDVGLSFGQIILYLLS